MGLRASAYHLIKYQSSPDGAFGDNTTYTQGTTARPDWEVQLGANYSRGPVRLSWTGNWQDTTKVYAGNGTLFPTVDQATVRFYRSYWIHSATAAYDVTEAARVQLTVDNVFDTIYPSVQYEIAGSPQSLGRTIMGQLIYKFCSEPQLSPTGGAPWGASYVLRDVAGLGCSSVRLTLSP